MKYTLLITIMLTGCSITPPAPIVTQYQTQLLTIPDILLQPCSVSEPPDREDYIKSTYEIKEDKLTNYSLHLLSDLRNCNDQLKQIKQLQTDQTKLIQEQNHESKTDAETRSRR